MKGGGDPRGLLTEFKRGVSPSTRLEQSSNFIFFPFIPSAQFQSLLHRKDLVYDLVLLGLVFQLNPSPSQPKALLKKVLPRSPKLTNCWSLCSHPTLVHCIHPSQKGSTTITFPKVISKISKAGCNLHGWLQLCPTLFPRPWDPLSFSLHITISDAFISTFPFSPLCLLLLAPSSCFTPAITLSTAVQDGDHQQPLALGPSSSCDSLNPDQGICLPLAIFWAAAREALQKG